MIPRAILRQAQVTEGEDNRSLHFSWFDTHPGDHFQQYITDYIHGLSTTSCSKLLITRGHVIYLRWEGTFGICVIMASIADDIYKIGIDSYNWVHFVSAYVDAELSNSEELVELFEQDFSDPEMKEIPKEIKRQWFDIAINSGTYDLDRSADNYHTNIANLFGFFPWIIFFATGGEVTSSSFILEVSIDAEPKLSLDEIYDHIDGKLDEQFWILIYQFVPQLNTIPNTERADTWYQYLQAAHDFTVDIGDYKIQISSIFQHKNLLTQFDAEFLRNYIQQLLMTVSNQESSIEICELLLRFATLLLELEFTELGKLTEATTLEHALNLSDSEMKRDVILELTQRSANWGDNHLISFIQSLAGLLADSNENKDILSEAINLISKQLKQSWDGMLCIVEGKLIADNIADALALRFEATQLLKEKFSRAEDIFSAIIWSLQYEWSATNRYQLVLSYLDYAFDTLPDEVVTDQSDVVIQSCVKHGRFDFLRYYLQYIRNQLSKLDVDQHEILMDKIEEVLPSPRDYPLIHIEFLITRLFTLRFHELEQHEREFNLVSQIFNSLNPTLTESKSSLEYILARVVEYGTEIGNWDIIGEARRRYLLMSQDRDRAHEHLQSIFFKFALDRSKLSKEQVNQQDIGIQLFNEGMKVSDLNTDYDLIVRIIPHIKKLAIKSRSYNALTNIVITEIKLKKLQNLEWIPELLTDIKTILKKGKRLDVTMIFSEAFTNLDLTAQERQELLQAQLELTEVEPDLLTADEIYEKRLELVQFNSDREEDREFVINNYQKGISELISKGDTQNLTNILLDAIEFAQGIDTPEIEEFKGLLLDNLVNVIEDFSKTKSTQIYQYLLTIWRRVIDLFMHSDLSMIIQFSSKLTQLNTDLHRQSSNNQYLRRAQLVMKELALVVDRSDNTLTDIDISTVLVNHNDVVELMIANHRDFGIINAIFHAAEVLHRFDQTDHLYPLIDQAIVTIKREIMIDASAQSSLFLLLLVLAEVAMFIEADFHPESLDALTTRADRLISFGLSLNLTSEIKNRLKDLQQSISREPSSIIHEYPFMIGEYLDETLQYQL